MHCEDIGPMLNQSLDRPESDAARRAAEHLESCASCNDALRAVARLREERARPVPAPRSGAFRRAVRAAAEAHGVGRRRDAGFWRGLAVGAAAAAGIAAAASMILSGGVADSVAPPAITLALHEPRAVSIAIDAPVPLREAEIQVMLRGAVDLQGFEGQRDIQWTTDLEQGINQLTLPVLATGVQGGQVQVVVTHGNRQKTFLVDVTIREPLREQENESV